MNIRKKVINLIDEYEDKKGKRPTRIRFNNIDLLNLNKGEIPDNILKDIITGEHKDLLGKKVWGLIIIEIDADETMVE